MIGATWNSFLETCDPPINSTRCPSNRHATFVVPSFDPERPLKKKWTQIWHILKKNCPNPLGKTVNYDKTTSFHDWDLGWFVGAVYQKNKRVCRINRVNLRCNSWWILCYFTAKRMLGQYVIFDSIHGSFGQCCYSLVMFPWNMIDEEELQNIFYS